MRHLEYLRTNGKAIVYILDDVLLQSIVFNFIEYLTSTLCINLQLGCPALNCRPAPVSPCNPLYLDSDYFSVSVLDPRQRPLLLTPQEPTVEPLAHETPSPTKGLHTPPLIHRYR